MRKVSSAPRQTLLRHPALVTTPLTVELLKSTLSSLQAVQKITLTVLCHVLPLQASPSAPRDLTSITLSAEGRLQLSWSPPLVTGGRSDLTYSVACEHCDGASCVPCGEKVRFEPGPTDLQDTMVIVSDLDSHLNYTFTVEAHSGVSQFGTERPSASITTALDYTGELNHTTSFLL